MKDTRFTDKAYLDISYYNVLENSLMPVTWIRSDGVIAHANKAAEEYLEYTAEELAQMYIYQIDPNFTKELTVEAFDHVRQIGREVFETKHKTKSGKIKDTEVVSTYVKTAHGEYAVCCMQDITDKLAAYRELEAEKQKLSILVKERTEDLESKVAELEVTKEELKQSEEILSKAFITTHDIITVNSLESGRYLDVNDSFCKTLGYKKEEVVGISSLALNIWDKPEDRANMINLVKKNGFALNYEAVFVRKDGSKLTGLMSASPQTINGEKALLTVTKEITTLKQLENELRELNSSLTIKVQEEVALRQKQESLLFEQSKFADMGQMINAIAHQWRQPLNALGLLVQDVASSYVDDELTKDEVELFEKHAFSLITYMSETIDQFRNFFKTSTEAVEFDLLSTVLEVFDLIGAQINMHGIKYAISYLCKGEEHRITNVRQIDDHQCRIVILGYQGELKQAILNLIYNAVDSIEERQAAGDKTPGEIGITFYTQGCNVILKVCDNGTGIPDNVQKKIFDPFFTTKEEQKGTGIGLYMTRLIVEKHNKGKISAENGEKGAEFTIVLPKAPKCC